MCSAGYGAFIRGEIMNDNVSVVDEIQLFVLISDIVEFENAFERIM